VRGEAHHVAPTQRPVAARRGGRARPRHAGCARRLGFGSGRAAAGCPGERITAKGTRATRVPRPRQRTEPQRRRMIRRAPDTAQGAAGPGPPPPPRWPAGRVRSERTAPRTEQLPSPALPGLANGTGSCLGGRTAPCAGICNCSARATGRENVPRRQKSTPRRQRAQPPAAAAMDAPDVAGGRAPRLGARPVRTAALLADCLARCNAPATTRLGTGSYVARPRSIGTRN
jgi:hypothetical protein